ncbi:DUF4336 domain-containing protein [Pelagovum pacificum]|uniref:DUF4336 domain-containing protein n=1 Tax=Pelagovum pacificum TaxID=2588711 RepID=A0A5C5G9F9_9RHOB|nr:DUF4336 domain-containing protein [Pelagovum pacificum]QQA42125.1 DUF4336 domain-containing protein [Pelagovum pacificum]TNY31213.1 DUF4336 domain-containing protein [Pelagovum pacificum]
MVKADPLIPYAPLGTLKPFAPGLWTADGGVIRMAYGGFSLPFTTRMVVAPLSGGGLWVWSPIAPTEQLLAEVARLGPVRHIISPNAIHYAHIPAWAEAFPEANVWASPGVRERAKSQGITVRFSDDLGERPPGTWAETLDQTIFEGSRLLREVVFFHRESRTLIVADLIENFELPRVRGRWLRTLMRIGGVTDPDGQMPRDLRLSYLGRRKAARASLERLLDWAPERLILAHGRCYEHDATDELRRAFRWLL